MEEGLDTRELMARPNGLYARLHQMGQASTLELVTDTEQDA